MELLTDEAKILPGTPEWDDVRALFETCLHLAPEERESVIEAATRGKPAVRAEVEALLADAEATETERSAESDPAEAARSLTERFESLSAAFKWTARIGLPFLLVLASWKAATVFRHLAREQADLAAAREMLHGKPGAK